MSNKGSEMTDHKCELCGHAVRVVGKTTLHYEQASEQLTRPGEQERIAELEVENERLKAKVERLTWRSVPMTVVHEDESITYDGPLHDGCRHCGAPRPHHLCHCPAGEE